MYKINSDGFTYTEKFDKKTYKYILKIIKNCDIIKTDDIIEYKNENKVILVEFIDKKIFHIDFEFILDIKDIFNISTFSETLKLVFDIFCYKFRNKNDNYYMLPRV